MLALERELRVRERPALQRGEGVRPEPLELVEELGERLSLAVAELGEPVERLECPTPPLLDDDARARDPVGALTLDQVPHDVERAPRVGALVRVGPRRGQSL